MEATTSSAPKHCSLGILCAGLCKRPIIYLTVISVFFFSVHHVLVRYIKDTVPVFEIIFVSYGMLFLLLIPFLIYLGESFRLRTREHVLMIFLSGLTFAAATFLFYFGLSWMPVGDTTAIGLTTTIFVGIFGRIFLKEPFDLVDLILVIIDLGGVVLIARPSFIFGGGDGREASALGPLAVLLSSGLYAATFLLTRRMGMFGINSFVIVFYHSLFIIITSALMTTFLSERGWVIPPCGAERYALLAIVFLNIIARCLLMYCYANEQAFLVSILSSNIVVFSYILEFAILGTAPNPIALLGAALMVSVSIVVSVRRMRNFSFSSSITGEPLTE